MTTDNQGAIFIASFADQCIREKVTMENPDVDKICGAYPSHEDYERYNEVMDLYEAHVASRTYHYPVKEEQDGKEIPESEFRLQHQFLSYPGSEKVWVDCTEVTYGYSEPAERRIIAIPIEPETEIKKVSLSELEPGQMFTYNGTWALKSEYRTDNGAVQAYIVGTGEMFWGGTDSVEKLNELIVRPIQVTDLEDLWRDIDLICDYADYGKVDKYNMIQKRIIEFNKTIKP